MRENFEEKRRFNMHVWNSDLKIDTDVWGVGMGGGVSSQCKVNVECKYKLTLIKIITKKNHQFKLKSMYIYIYY